MRLHLKNELPYKFKTKNYWLINEEMIQLFPVVLKGNWHISTVKFICSVVSNSLWPPWTVALQASLSITTCRVHSNSCPLRQWFHPTISSSIIPFSSCLQSFQAPRYYQISQFFSSGGQSIGVSASVSVLQMNIQDWFPLR